MNKATVTCQWLNNHLADENLIILDATMPEPNTGDNSVLEVIKGAQAFDYANVVCDQTASLPCTMPSAEYFTQQAQLLGVNADSSIVVYDQRGLFYAPRAWWMFKSMGFDNVYVLDGGLPKWKSSGFSMQQGYAKSPIVGNFVAHYESTAFVGSNEILEIVNQHQNHQTTDNKVIDVRSQSRFDGIEKETRAGLRSGHIPHSENFPFTLLIKNGEFVSEAEQRVLLKQYIPDAHNKYAFSCGSGVTACIVLLSAYMQGYENLSVYDGSWTDWGAGAELPIVEADLN
jgi:thiosulfate/3-mercaptopyruvate sulfurtransferase